MEIDIIEESLLVVGRVVIASTTVKIGSKQEVIRSHAICSVEDNFDPEIGEDIAYSKNDKKVKEFCKKQLEKKQKDVLQRIANHKKEIQRINTFKKAIEFLEEEKADCEDLLSNLDLVVDEAFEDYYLITRG